MNELISIYDECTKEKISEVIDLIKVLLDDLENEILLTGIIK